MVSPTLFVCGSSSKATPMPKMKKSLASKQSLNAMAKQNRVVLLGTSGSGKSTLRARLEHRFRREPRAAATTIQLIHRFVLRSMKQVIEQSDAIARRNSLLKTAIKRSHQTSKQAVLDASIDDPIQQELAQHLETVWKDDGLQRTWEQRAKYHVPSSLAYFMERLDFVSHPSYEPTDSDLVHLSIRTTGIVTKKMKSSTGVPLELVDVGGQRHERQKWKRVLHGCRGIVYVVSLSDYDQLLHEDDHTNRLQEALRVFSSIANAPQLASTRLCLVFTKQDELEHKLKTSSFKQCFPQHSGDDRSVESVVAFIEALFLAHINIPKRVSLVSKLNLLDEEEMARLSQKLPLELVLGMKGRMTHAKRPGRPAA